MDSQRGGDDDYDPTQGTKQRRTPKHNKKDTNKKKRSLLVGRGSAPTITLQRENLEELHNVGWTIWNLAETDKTSFEKVVATFTPEVGKELCTEHVFNNETLDDAHPTGKWLNALIVLLANLLQEEMGRGCKG